MNCLRQIKMTGCSKIIRTFSYKNIKAMPIISNQSFRDGVRGTGDGNGTGGNHGGDIPLIKFDDL